MDITIDLVRMSQEKTMRVAMKKVWFWVWSNFRSILFFWGKPCSVVHVRARAGGGGGGGSSLQLAARKDWLNSEPPTVLTCTDFRGKILKVCTEVLKFGL